jgi:hypothetical protein
MLKYSIQTATKAASRAGIAHPRSIPSSHASNGLRHGATAVRVDSGGDGEMGT